MKTTLDLPDDLATEVQRRAERDGRNLADEVVDLVRKGLAALEPESSQAIMPTIAIDPSTGLPVVYGAPNAPISRMSSQEIHAMLRQSADEEEFERFSRAIRR